MLLTVILSEFHETQSSKNWIAEKMSQGNFEWVTSLFWLQLPPYVFLRKLFRQTPPSFPAWRAFWVASNICSCRTPPSSPLSSSSLIQTIIDATILEVIRARNICRKCLYKNSEIIWRFISLTPPLQAYFVGAGAQTLWGKAAKFKTSALKYDIFKSLVWNSSNLFNSQISKIAENVFLGLFFFLIGRNACYIFR